MHDPVITRILTLQQRIAVLQGRATELAPEHPLLLEDALSQLAAALEELLAAEEELREQRTQIVAAQTELATEHLERQRFAALFDGAPDSYLLTDLDGVITAANRAAEALLKRPADHVVGIPLVAIIPVEWHAELYALYGRVRTSETVQVWETQLQPRHSAPVDVDVRVVRTNDPSGGTAQARWLLRDISDRKRAELAARQSDARFATIVRASPAAICITRRRDGVVLEANPAFLALTGYPRDAVLGQPLETLGLWADAAAWARLGAAVIAQGSVSGIELQRRTPAGAHEALLASAELIELDGEACIVSIYQDITARKRAEAEVRQLNVALEQRVAARTAELVAANAAKDALLVREQTVRQQLATSEARYRAIAELTSDAVFSALINPDRSVELEWIAGAFAEMTGYDQQQLRAAGTLRALLHQDDRACFTQHLAQLLQGRDDACTLRIVTRAGQVRWLRSQGHPEIDPASGAVVRVIGAISDITEQRQAEEAIRFQASLLDAVDVAVIATDMEYRITFWNRFAAQLYRCPAEAVLGRSMLDIVPETLAGEPAATVLERLRRGSRWTGEVVLQRRDGQPFPALLTEAPIHGHAGTMVGAVSVVYDLTERKRAEAALREMQQSLDLAVEAAEIGVYEADLVTGAARTNLWHNRIFGYTEPPAAWGPSIFREHIVAEDRATFDRAYADALATGVLDVLVRIRRPDGTIRWITNRGRFCYDAQQQPVQLRGVTLDFTTRKQAEQDRSLLLERLVTAQEDERRRLAQDLHDEAGRALTALQLGLTALREQVGPPPELAARVRQLQSIATTFGGELQVIARRLRPAALDDQGLFSAVENYLAEWSDHYAVPADLQALGSLEQRLPGPVELTIYRVLQEALTNIARHALAHHVDVILELRPTHVQLIVEDDGQGFDLDGVAGAPAAPAGLGLLGMQERVQMLGGALTIESLLGRGTTLFVRVPLDRTAEAGYDEAARVPG